MEKLADGNDNTIIIPMNILREMAENAPAQFNLKNEKFFKSIYPYIFHGEQDLKYLALETLEVSIHIKLYKLSVNMI